MSCSSQYRYEFIDIGPMGGTWSCANAISEDGTVVGSSYIENGDKHAFIWRNGVITDLGTLGGKTSEALAIDNSGTIAGYSYDISSVMRSVIWRNGKIEQLDVDNRGALYDINDNSQIAGVTGSYPQTKAVLYEGDVIRYLSSLGGQYSWAYAVNNSAAVTGWAHNSAGKERAVIWLGDSVMDLDILCGVSSRGHVINDSNEIVGYYLTADSKFRSFHWRNGIMTDIGGFGGNLSTASGINNSGQVVGVSTFTDYSDGHAYIWQNGVLEDLNDLVIMTEGSYLASALDINDKGQIVGSCLINGIRHGYLLNPVPEPSSVSILIVCLSGSLFICKRGKRRTEF